MPNNKYYLINSPKVVDEIFEDEIIVINFDNGDYFSLRQSATDVWKGIKNGQCLEMILENLQTKYEEDEQELRTAVSEMTDAFLKANLISPSSEVPEKNDIPIEEITEKIPFESPIFEKFTDMNDLLLLDPVHDVDEGGWPHVNPSDQNG